MQSAGQPAKHGGQDKREALIAPGVDASRNRQLAILARYFQRPADGAALQQLEQNDHDDQDDQHPIGGDRDRDREYFRPARRSPTPS